MRETPGHQRQRAQQLRRALKASTQRSPSPLAHQRWTILLCAVLCVGSCTPPQPVPTQVTLPAGKSERAETAVVTATSADGNPSVVTVFNDFSEKPLPGSGLKDLEFASNDSTITYRIGASVVGWATTSTGSTWSYHGKLAPPTGWAALLGDPTIAVDPVVKSNVYIATLAISVPAWNAAYGAGSTTTQAKPSGVCVFRSSDAGVSFGQAACVSVGVAGDVDKTAIVVDGAGHVFVATLDRLQGVTRVWRSGSQWSNLVENPITCDSVNDPLCPTADAPKAFLFEDEPRLVTDGTDAWLFTFRASTTSPKLGFVSWDSNGFANGWLDMVANCTGASEIHESISPDVTIGGATLVQPIRQAYRYAVDIGFTEFSQTGAIRLAYEYENTASLRQVRVVELGGDQGTGCAALIGRGTDEDPIAPSQHKNFMVSLSYANRGTPPGGGADWHLAHLAAGPGIGDPSTAYVAVQHRPFFFVLPPGGVALPIPFTQVDLWHLGFACARPGGYWGDYFGIAQFKPVGGAWSTIGAFTDSGPAPPCQVQTSVTARPMQVASNIGP